MSQTPDDPADTQIPASEHEDEGRYDAGDPHRRRSAHLYGLIVSGAVLATAPESFRISRVAFMLVATLAIYWIAETYVHWIATARSTAGTSPARSAAASSRTAGRSWPRASCR
ncbi:MAG: hypothetical protein AB7V23_00495, partial [Candidatus Nanopelagicales bacterium]